MDFREGGIFFSRIKGGRFQYPALQIVPSRTLEPDFFDLTQVDAIQKIAFR